MITGIGQSSATTEQFINLETGSKCVTEKSRTSQNVYGLIDDQYPVICGGDWGSNTLDDKCYKVGKEEAVHTMLDTRIRGYAIVLDDKKTLWVSVIIQLLSR